MNQRSPVEVRQLVSNRVSNRVHACKMVCRCWEAGSIRPIVNLSFCSSDLPSEGPLYLLIVGRIKVRRTSHGQYWTKEQKGVSVKLLHLCKKYISTSKIFFFSKTLNAWLGDLTNANFLGCYWFLSPSLRLITAYYYERSRILKPPKNVSINVFSAYKWLLNV